MTRKRLKGEIEFENVAFAYNDEAKVLTDVSFKIKAGQMVGVVGPDGMWQVHHRQSDSAILRSNLRQGEN